MQPHASIKIGYKRITKNRYTHWSIILNGKRYSERCGYVSDISDSKYAIIYEDELGDRLKELSFNELCSAIPSWKFPEKELDDEINLSVNIHSASLPRKEASVTYTLEFDFEEWKYPWSIAEYGDRFIENAHKQKEQASINYTVSLSDMSASGGIKLKFAPPPKQALSDYLTQTRLIVDTIAETTRVDLLLKSKKDSVVSIFEFPPELRTPCKQYLAFFSEFLLNLGVKSRTEILDEANKVLFSVTPEDRKIALSNIQDALALYLSLPEHRLPRSAFHYKEDLLQKLADNIQHLQKSLSSPSEVNFIKTVNGASSGGTTDAEKEGFWDGRLQIKKWSKGPVELDLPRIIKALKNRFPVLKKLD
jgi:hypothetical protein